MPINDYITHALRSLAALTRQLVAFLSNDDLNTIAILARELHNFADTEVQQRRLR